ncbi:FAD-dependent oxidoreductase [Ruegeria sediminis]|uniref:FAD-dependent oxidoreductase n=1 Tax=Ruegeria sediminis TaxID=2583820 RepID=A0ABY2WX64_9RHOB|nr:FAD-dependent oxidoreductase [Ruegeria sediminis]TMV07041.1 FAD-dependent oxidoreductase [Ruegeria sediminis]
MNRADNPVKAPQLADASPPERNTDKPHVIILGAGPAGLAAAHSLTRSGQAKVTVIERAAVAGGNSASFPVEGVICDYGSHRFHPAAEPEVLRDVKALLGEDLMLRPRHGRIRLGGKWIHFPLKLSDALIRLPKPFALSLIGDMVLKPFRKKNTGPATFSTVLYDGLGPTISENFYFPYVRKLWGLDPDKLAVTLAERRVGSGSVGKILMKMLRLLPGLRSETAGRFYYPRRGFGQISDAMLKSAREAGATFLFETEITRIERLGDRISGLTIRDGATERQLSGDLILSTIPLTGLTRLIDSPPPEVVDAARAIRFRGMILLYLVLESEQFTEFDAHYFPEQSIPISRMSEPKNYSASAEPKGVTVLCAELPCDPDEKWWSMSDEELGLEFTGWLEQLGLPVTVPVRRCETRRLSHAYPVYDAGYQARFDAVDNWLSGLDGLLVFGRQGLFAHDNTHHAFAMAYGAADCIDAKGNVDRAKWNRYREVFATHVVED